jgi:hypothetical protein
MASTTPTQPPHLTNYPLKEGSPDPSAAPSAALPNGDQPRRTSFNFLRRVSLPAPLRLRLRLRAARTRY